MAVSGKCIIGLTAGAAAGLAANIDKALEVGAAAGAAGGPLLGGLAGLLVGGTSTVLGGILGGISGGCFDRLDSQGGNGPGPVVGVVTKRSAVVILGIMLMGGIVSLVTVQRSTSHVLGSLLQEAAELASTILALVVLIKRSR
jgi:hypothetical protein